MTRILLAAICAAILMFAPQAQAQDHSQHQAHQQVFKVKAAETPGCCPGKEGMGKEGMKDGAGCKSGQCPMMKDGKSGDCCKDMKDGKPCSCCRDGQCPMMGGMKNGHAMPHDMSAPAVTGDAALDELNAAMATMHADMAVSPTGDPDADFVRGMIPHHQGAIDMASIVLKHGDDPETRALARTIIRAQKGEIALMRRWLERRQLPEKAPVNLNR